MSDVRFVTTHFNPCGYSRPREIFSQWFDTLPPIIRSNLIVIELCFDDDRSELQSLITDEAEYFVYRGTRKDNLMWQKERLVNEGFYRLYREGTPFKYFGWLDRDMVFQDTSGDFVSQSIDLLDQGYCAVQMLSVVHYLDRFGEIAKSHPSSFTPTPFDQGNPGGPWITTKSFFQEIGGLPDRHITGGGDCLWFTLLAYDSDLDALIRRYLPGDGMFANLYRREISNRRKLLRNYLPATHLVNCEIHHLWHGELKDRNYVGNWKTTLNHFFHPFEDLLVRNGLLSWNTSNQGLKEDVAYLFSNRREDG